MGSFARAFGNPVGSREITRCELQRSLQPGVSTRRGFVTSPGRSMRQRTTCARSYGSRLPRARCTKWLHDLFYDRKSVDELATVIATLAQEHGTVEAAQYRDAVGLGRKRAIQILEFFDRVGHTRRMRDARVLRADSGWRGG